MTVSPLKLLKYQFLKELGNQTPVYVNVTINIRWEGGIANCNFIFNASKHRDEGKIEKCLLNIRDVFWLLNGCYFYAVKDITGVGFVQKQGNGS